MRKTSKSLFVAAVSAAATLGVFVSQASATTLLGTTTTAKRTTAAAAYKTQTLSIDAAGQATCKKGNQLTAQATWYLGKVTKDSAYVDRISVTYKAIIAGKDVSVGRVNLVNGKNSAVYSPGARYTALIKGGKSLTQTYPIKKTVTFNKSAITLSRYFDVGMVGSEAMWCGGKQQFFFKLKPAA